MTLSRRETLWVCLGGVASATFANPVLAATVEELVSAFGGAATATTDGITMIAPEIAKNGNTVPISVEAPGAVAIMIMASGNPEPAVCTATFGPASGKQVVATRIRLAKTQDVIALAKMADGSIKQTAATVKVTIGGCGG